MNPGWSADRLSRALHPPSLPPTGQGWNHADIAEFLPQGSEALRAAAVLVGLVDRGEGEQVLLTRRNEGLRHHGGQISFPGGRIEDSDADPVAAALREADEEIGLSPAQASVLGYLDPFTTITGFHVYPVVAQVAADFLARPDPSEVDEVFEVPLDFIVDPANHRRDSRIFQGSERHFWAMPFGTYYIWGATAGMLVNLSEVLRR